MSWLEEIARFLGGGPGAQGAASIGQTAMGGPSVATVGGGTTSGGPGVAGGPADSGASSVYQMLYGSPEYKRQALQSSMMGMASGLLSAAGPSKTPTSFLSALGQGIMGAQQGMTGAQDRFAKDLMLGAQFDSNRQNMAIQRQWMDYMKTMAGGGRPAGAAPGTAPPGASPQGGGPISSAGGGPPNPNNPGNIIAGRNPDGTLSFRQYSSPDEGVAAVIKNVQAYPQAFNGGQPMALWDSTIDPAIAKAASVKRLQKQPLTPDEQAQLAKLDRTIAGRWAPYDGRTTDPQAWAAAVAQGGQLPLDKPIDINNPQAATGFVRGVHGIEHGPRAAYAPEVYQRGVQMAFGGGAPPRQMAAAGPSAPTGAGLSVPRVTSPEQLQSLPPGTTFIAPDGSTRVR